MTRLTEVQLSERSSPASTPAAATASDSRRIPVPTLHTGTLREPLLHSRNDSFSSSNSSPSPSPHSHSHSDSSTSSFFSPSSTANSDSARPSASSDPGSTPADSTALNGIELDPDLNTTPSDSIPVPPPVHLQRLIQSDRQLIGYAQRQSAALCGTYGIFLVIAILNLIPPGNSILLSVLCFCLAISAYIQYLMLSPWNLLKQWPIEYEEIRLVSRYCLPVYINSIIMLGLWITGLIFALENNRGSE